MPFEIAVACPRDAPCNGRLEYTVNVLADPPPEVALDPSSPPPHPATVAANSAAVTAALDAFIRTSSRERPAAELVSATAVRRVSPSPPAETIRPAAPPLQRN